MSQSKFAASLAKLALVSIWDARNNAVKPRSEIVSEPLVYHFDLVSAADAEDSTLPERTASSRAVAEYLADMIGQLEGMARLSGFDLLVYLLAMARVEAQANSRAAEDRRGPARY